jgi:hypothetical protein
MDFLSARFAGNPTLEAILNDPDPGTVKLEPGPPDPGPDPVQAVQQALWELDAQRDLFDEGVAAIDQLIADLAGTITVADAGTPDLPATKPVLGTLGVERAVTTDDGVAQEFGKVYDKRGVGAFLVKGPIFETYFDTHGPLGDFGYPVSGIVDRGDRTSRCDFENGSLIEAADGTVTSTEGTEPIALLDPDPFGTGTF